MACGTGLRSHTFCRGSAALVLFLNGCKVDGAFASSPWCACSMCRIHGVQ